MAGVCDTPYHEWWLWYITGCCCRQCLNSSPWRRAAAGVVGQCREKRCSPSPSNYRATLNIRLHFSATAEVSLFTNGFLSGFFFFFFYCNRREKHNARGFTKASQRDQISCLKIWRLNLPLEYTTLGKAERFAQFLNFNKCVKHLSKLGYNAVGIIFRTRRSGRM